MATLSEYVCTIHKTPVKLPTNEVVTGLLKFNIRGTKDAAGVDDFKDALTEFKERIPWNKRSWDSDEKEWTVVLTESIEAAMADIFGNAQDIMDEAREQAEGPF